MPPRDDAGAEPAPPDHDPEHGVILWLAVVIGLAGVIPALGTGSWGAQATESLALACTAAVPLIRDHVRRARARRVPRAWLRRAARSRTPPGRPEPPPGPEEP